MKETNLEKASSRLDHLPEGLQEIYAMPNINDSILIYEGPLNIEQNGKKVSETGQVKFRWLPVPSPRFHVTLPHSSEDNIDLGAINLSTSDSINSSKAILDNLQLHNENNKTCWKASGWFSTIEIGNPKDLSSVLFHIPNLNQYLGENIRETAKSSVRRGRAIINGGGWQITLDSLPKTNKKFIEQLSGNGGYAITHIGKFSKLDNANFSIAEAKDLLGSIAYFLSFCRGLWTAPILPVGMDTKGTRTWEQWRDWRIDRFLNVQSWINPFGHESISTSFPGFFRRITDETWGEPIRLSLWWYLECNKRAGGMEGSMILAQSAFELLAWTLLVEEDKILSEDGYEKIPASDRLRLLLAQCNIPHSIPTCLTALPRLSKEYNWSDGPQALTEIRNSLVHPKSKKRRKILDAEPLEVFEAWSLSIWYLELILLWLFKYKGSYTNRLRRECWKNEAVENVPWNINGNS